MKLPQPPLLVITDRKLCGGDLPERLRGAAKGGCRWFMIREKDLEGNELEELVRAVRATLAPWDPVLLLNGAPTVAARCSLQGVHLPQGQSLSRARATLGEEALIGVSAHNEAECELAEEGGADYVTLSPIFTSTSKGRHLPPLGLDALRAASARLSIPVLALGGITAPKAAACRKDGASGIAVLGAVMGASDAAAAVRSTLTAWGAD